MEYIRGTIPYSENELLSKHEIDFFRILKRVEQIHRDKAQKAEERRQRLAQNQRK